MKILTPDRNLYAFLALCVIWGATWIGIKAGIETVPPLFFAGTRFTCAGLIFIFLLGKSESVFSVALRDWPRLFFVSLMMITFCYGPLFWGMLYIDSGTAAVLELTLTPIALLGFALLFRQESFDPVRLCAIGLGVFGICILFAPDILAAHESGLGTGSFKTLLGGAAVASAAITYALGSVLARPLLNKYSAMIISGVTTLVGGIALVAASFLFEDHTVDALTGQWGMNAWLGWLFLVLFGSCIGYQIYLRLLKDIGASAAGSYAFVSPIVAVLLGAAVYGEAITITKVLGMMVMLLAAYFVIAYKKPSQPQ